MMDTDADHITWTSLDDKVSARDRAVHDVVRDALAGVTAAKVWSRFEFVTLGGASFDVDLLVATPAGAFFIELFDHPGDLVIGEKTWRLMREGAVVDIVDDPVRALSVCARLFREVLDNELAQDRTHAPPITPLIVLTQPDFDVRSDSNASASHVVHLPGGHLRPTLAAALRDGDVPGESGRPTFTRAVLERLGLAMDRVGVGRSGKIKRVRDWRCTRLIETSANHQDFLAARPKSNDERRVRVFTSPADTSREQKERLHRAARREYELLEGLRHHGILQVQEFVDDRSRPALVFEHPPRTIRLDHHLELRPDLTLKERLELVRDVTEAILYAHRKQVAHRALTPRSVRVVRDVARGGVKVYNWQAASNAERRTGSLHGTQHIDDYVAQDDAVHLAPEVFMGLNVGEAADVWGLGVITYRIFAGQPPAESVAGLHRRLRSEKGLRLSASANGVPASLEALVFAATHPVQSQRTRSVKAFMEALQEVWREVVGESDHGDPIDPLEAQPGDELEGRYKVIRRLGSGASATALLVRDVEVDREYVLKVAQTERDRVRLEREAEDLNKLSEAKHVIELRDVVNVHGRHALAIEYAGETLRERLTTQGRLTLDDLGRFGDDIFAMLEELESAHVLHRDIKPANIGVGPAGKSTRQLMLFDFSLAGVALDQIHIGTTAYRDPFLSVRGRWDARADRYAAVLVLYELATGTLPVWGDGQTPPSMDEAAELVVEPALLPVSVREKLEGFFRRGLHRHDASRFDHPSEMRNAWRAIFEDTTQTTHDDVEASIEAASHTTRLEDLEVSETAREALDRLNVISVGDLLEMSDQSLFFRRGLSSSVRKEIQELRNALLLRLPGIQEPDAEDERDYARMSLTRCLDYALDKDADQLFEILGLNEPDGEVRFATRGDMAEALGRERAEFETFFEDIAKGWSRKTSLEPLRDDVVRALEANSGVMGADELASALLTRRGALTGERSQRMAMGGAAARIAVEAEESTTEPRFWMVRVGERAFVTNMPNAGGVLRALGAKASELAAAQPLRSTSAAFEELQRVLTEQGAAPMRKARLRAIAALASPTAALSSRSEFYPVGMSAERALRLSKGVLASLQEVTQEEVAERVRSRYPEAEPLPTGDALHALMESLEVPMRWDATRAGGRGAYVYDRVQPLILASSTTRVTSAYPSLHGGASARDPRALERDLDNAWEWGGFRVLMVPERDMSEGIRRVTERFEGGVVVNGDEVWLEVFEQAVATFPKLGWDLLERGDSPQATEREVFNFDKLVRTWVLPRVEERLSGHAGAEVILVHAGLFGRYARLGAMQVLERWSDSAGTSTGPRCVWLMLPTDGQSREPHIDGEAVARTSPSQVTHLPRWWFRGREERV
jgi:serine/threonine protein kinase